MARGRYLQFLDADDHFEANLLQDAYYRAYDSATDILLFGMKSYQMEKCTLFTIHY